ncbi:hypothetical protein BCR41DRAFT_370336 [Lobosporangium transversale]|uniref:Uncharacterized protein n=1 Tax=Lobosporangium transversale TaxID=64571 RepID=A0A1Y2GPJ2_9FUNG|nr:hypothetical protein BCR41DRAFT_370336 [Lobosporangium transversale]ORZ17526.1 hypothetical protein BCR41DRAFT_370336 [Lobosporangium transversale]|eukprot:XP_021881913.1 hypothetical protein BCR41DRAFT_370336 [Lobosporangium transversale]
MLEEDRWPRSQLPVSTLLETRALMPLLVSLLPITKGLLSIFAYAQARYRQRTLKKFYLYRCFCKTYNGERYILFSMDFMRTLPGRDSSCPSFFIAATSPSWQPQFFTVELSIRFGQENLS